MKGGGPGLEQMLETSLNSVVPQGGIVEPAAGSLSSPPIVNESLKGTQDTMGKAAAHARKAPRRPEADLPNRNVPREHQAPAPAWPPPSTGSYLSEELLEFAEPEVIEFDDEELPSAPEFKFDIELPEQDELWCDDVPTPQYPGEVLDELISEFTGTTTTHTQLAPERLEKAPSILGADTGDNRGLSGSPTIHLTEKENPEMAHNINECLKKLGSLDGFVGAALANSESGMALGKHSVANFNLDVAAAVNSEVVKAKYKAIRSLKLNDKIEDILISLGTQYHLLRPTRQRPNLFFYLVLDRRSSNLALARMALEDAEANLSI